MAMVCLRLLLCLEYVALSNTREEVKHLGLGEAYEKELHHAAANTGSLGFRVIMMNARATRLAMPSMAKAGS